MGQVHSKPNIQSNTPSDHPTILNTYAARRGYEEGCVPLVLGDYRPLADSDYPSFTTLNAFQAEFNEVEKQAKEHNHLWFIVSFLPENRPSANQTWTDILSADQKTILEHLTKQGHHVFYQAGGHSKHFGPQPGTMCVALRPTEDLGQWHPALDFGQEFEDEYNRAIASGSKEFNLTELSLWQDASWSPEKAPRLLPLEQRLVDWVKREGHKVSFTEETEDWYGHKSHAQLGVGLY